VPGWGVGGSIQQFPRRYDVGDQEALRSMVVDPSFGLELGSVEG
jgi:hypothetical protein